MYPKWGRRGPCRPAAQADESLLQQRAGPPCKSSIGLDLDLHRPVSLGLGLKGLGPGHGPCVSSLPWHGGIALAFGMAEVLIFLVPSVGIARCVSPGASERVLGVRV